MYRFILLLFLILFETCQLFGQFKTDFYPVQFNQYTRSYTLINPASICQYSSLETDLGYKRNIGSFSTISTYYASVGFRPSKDSKNPSHNAFGLRFDSDREGKYIGRTRMYGLYAFHTKITSKIFLSAGIDFGFFNMSIKGTPSTGNTSTFIPDADAGIWVWGATYKIGISLNQLLKGSLQPIKEVIELPVHANFVAAKRINIAENLSIMPSILVRYPYYKEYNADYTLECTYKPITGGVGFKHNQGIVFLAGLSGLKISNGNLNISLAYNAPMSGSTTNISNIELALKFTLGVFEKKKQNEGLPF